MRHALLERFEIGLRERRDAVARGFEVIEQIRGCAEEPRHRTRVDVPREVCSPYLPVDSGTGDAERCDLDRLRMALSVGREQVLEGGELVRGELLQPCGRTDAAAIQALEEREPRVRAADVAGQDHARSSLAAP